MKERKKGRKREQVITDIEKGSVRKEEQKIQEEGE